MQSFRNGWLLWRGHGVVWGGVHNGAYSVQGKKLKLTILANQDWKTGVAKKWVAGCIVIWTWEQRNLFVYEYLIRSAAKHLFRCNFFVNWTRLLSATIGFAVHQPWSARGQARQCRSSCHRIQDTSFLLFRVIPLIKLHISWPKTSFKINTRHVITDI